MSKTHWKSIADKSEYLGKQHIDPDNDLVVTIKWVEAAETFNGRKKETARIMYFEEPDVRPMILNSTNGNTIANLYGSPYREDWVGKRIALFVDPHVNNPSGGAPGGLRVRPYIPKEDRVICEDCGSVIEPHDNYSVNKIVTMSRSKYGAALCWSCAMARKEAAE